MRTTVNIDEVLMLRAAEYSGITSRSLLINAGLTALVERGAARRLALLGGSDPNAAAAPRRRPPLPYDEFWDFVNQTESSTWPTA